MTSIASQSVEQLGGPRSVLSRQRRDHVRLYALLDELRACDPDQSGPLLISMYRLVFPHAFAEEAVLWPTIRRLVPDGHELTLKNEIEHQRINERVRRLEDLPRGCPEWRSVLNEVIALLHQDVRDEEDALLPRLQQVLSAVQLRLLGAQWALVRGIAPTRCHPVVSRRPPGNILSALPLSFIDRLRDRMDLLRYCHRAGGAVAGPLGAALTKAANAVEHLPGMTRGEDRATHARGPSVRAWKSAGLAAALVAGVVLLRRVGPRSAH